MWFRPEVAPELQILQTNPEFLTQMQQELMGIVAIHAQISVQIGLWREVRERTTRLIGNCRHDALLQIGIHVKTTPNNHAIGGWFIGAIRTSALLHPTNWSVTVMSGEPDRSRIVVVAKADLAHQGEKVGVCAS